MVPVTQVQGQFTNTVNPRVRPRRQSSVSRIWRSKRLVFGGMIVAVILFLAIFASVIAPYNPNGIDYRSILQGPGPKHIFGTDDLGRDLFSRILIGARTSMEVSLGAVVVGLVIGIPVGLLTGYYRGFMDDWIIMRIVDALQAFPFLILALVLAAMLGPGIGNAMIAIGVGYLPIFIRIIRGQVIAEIRKEYVEAARMVGAHDWRIMFRHIFPNITT